MLELIKRYKASTDNNIFLRKRTWLVDLINNWFGESLSLKVRKSSVPDFKKTPLKPTFIRPRDKGVFERFFTGDNNTTRRKNKANYRASHALIDSFSKRELNSKSDEIRLDGSPNAFENRDNGKFGSFPSYDDYSEESRA